MSLADNILPVDWLRTTRGVLSLAWLLGLALLPVPVVGLVNAEWIEAGRFGGMSAGALVLGRFAGRPMGQEIPARESILIMAGAFALFSIIGSLGYIGHAAIIDCLFESVSGFTTTGLTVIPLQDLPITVLFYRSYSQWLGGVAIVALTITMLRPHAGSSIPILRDRFGKQEFRDDLRTVALQVVGVYGGLSVLCFGCIWALGADPFIALLYTLTTTSTAGFSPHAQSVAYFDLDRVRVVLMVFMFLSAMSFPTLTALVRRPWRRPPGYVQLRAMLILAGIFTVSFVLAPSPREDVVGQMFDVVSAITTTGFSASSVSEWNAGLTALAIVAMIVGGSAGSTAGGVKVWRIGALLRLVRWTVLRALLPPTAAVPVRYGSQTLSNEETRQLTGFFVIYLLVLTGSIMVFTMYGFPLVDAVFENTSALSTVGLSRGLTAPDLAAELKGVLMVEMWLGRVEIFPVLLLLHPRLWVRGLRQ